MTVLLDASVLIPLAVIDHVHHDDAEAWFAALEEQFATCPVTQGALIRLVVRAGGTSDQATEVLNSVTAHPRHEFWPDDVPYDLVSLAGVVGHRQVTDAYLAALARHRTGTLATLDGGLAALHTDVARLIGDDPPGSGAREA